MTAPDSPVVILNMHYTGLAIARDLWRPGRKLIGLSSDKSFFGNRSKYVSFRLFPDTETAPEACRDFLMELAADLEGKPVLFPTRDHDVHFIMRYRDELSSAYTLLYPSSEILSSILDKSSLAAIAVEAGVYCPQTVEVTCAEDLEATRDQLAFPSVIKPVVAASWRRDGIRTVVGDQKAIRVEDFDTLRALYVAIAEFDKRVAVQEYIPGPETNLVVFGSCCDFESEIVAWFTGRKFIQYPPNAGTGVVVEARPVPEIVELSARLLKRLRYVGLSEVEYKFDEGKNRYALIEINTRHWDQHGLGTAAGVNLSETAYQLLHGRAVQPGTQLDRTVRWIAEDSFLVSLMANLRSRSYPWSMYFGALKGRTSLAVFNWRDPMPALYLWQSLLRDVVRRGFGRAAKLVRFRNRESS
ncbi:MAG: ATP-grasp domain-containing protein [Woeseiaceae bacterium]|nr:ATP-grasp domain-containing protein [Woeseiaceae bacterium]